MQDQTYFDEDTLFKVALGLHDAGIQTEQITDAISQMINRGILFRERVPDGVAAEVATVVTRESKHIFKKILRVGVLLVQLARSRD